MPNKGNLKQNDKLIINDPALVKEAVYYNMLQRLQSTTKVPNLYEHFESSKSDSVDNLSSLDNIDTYEAMEFDSGSDIWDSCMSKDIPLSGRSTAASKKSGGSDDRYM